MALLRLLRGGQRALMVSSPSFSTSSAAASAPSKKPTALLKVVPVSPAMATFLGSPEVSRTEAVKKVWAYIKDNNLQNPTNKREVHCDEKLKVIFDGKDKVGFLEIAKLISSHFKKAS